MGLLDVLTGMRNGPRGGGRGMSPITMALLGLLAYKAVKGFSAGKPAGPGMAPAGGGLGDLLKQFRGAGKSEVADSWVGRDENKAIGPGDLSRILTPEQIEFLSERTGLTREQLLAGLAAQLPAAVDELTPQGRLPAPDEFDRPAGKTA